MIITLTRENLLEPLQQLIGVVERKQALPILGHVLLKVVDETLTLAATDLEIELVSQTSLAQKAPEAFETALPARKLLDIIRSLPEAALIEFYQDQQKVILRSGRSRFTLLSLPAATFPHLEEEALEKTIEVAADEILALFQRASFAMAQQDMRYYLNGLFLQLDPKQLLAVATDGHRLALGTSALEWPYEPQEVIVPRKSVLELMRLIPKSTEKLKIRWGKNHIQVQMSHLSLTSKLIDGRFPNYKRLVSHDGDKVISISREALKQALVRTSILSNEKFRGVRLQLREGLLIVSANNPEREEAEEILQVEHSGFDLDIGFNVAYLLDALNASSSEEVKLTFKDPDSSIKIEEADPKQENIWLIMPVKLV